MGNLFNKLENYFYSTSNEQLDKEWKEIKHLNEIDNGGTLEYMLKEYKERMEMVRKLLTNK